MYKDNYYMMYKDLKVGMLSYDYINSRFSFEFDKGYNGFPPYPLVKYGEDMQSTEVKEEDIREWIADRVIQECRPEIPEVLKRLKLYDYDEWDISRRLSGMSADDYFWLTKDQTLDYRCFNTR